MKIFIAVAAALSLLASALAQASVHELPVYELRIRPDYLVNDREAFFQVENNFNSSLDSFHIDFVERRWTKFDEFGSTTGSWTAAEDAYMNPANPQGWLCLAGPWAFAGCVIAVPIGFATCNAMANAAVRRAQQACNAGGRSLEIRNSGVCGQNMETRCRTNVGHLQEP